MSELVMQTMWVRASQVIFVGAALSASAACNQISEADTIRFDEPNDTVHYYPRCKDKDVMVAIHGRYGSWLDSVSVTCAELTANGTLGKPYESMVYGGSMGENDYKAECQPGQVLGELKYKQAPGSSVYINQVSVGCATVSDWKSSGMVAYSSTYIGVDTPNDTNILTLSCSAGKVAAGMDVDVSDNHVSDFPSLHCAATL